jgi:thiamine kinase-like enzyme
MPDGRHLIELTIQRGGLMSKFVQILPESESGHRAATVWGRLQPSRSAPVSIETLEQKIKKKDKHKRAIYRLVGVGWQGGAVIAKRCRLETGLIERAIYEQILPHLPIPSLHFYGFAQEDDEFCWLFLEDAGRERFSPLIEEHRVLAARWLGLMHTAAARLTTTVRLPDHGPDYYLEHLRSARLTILRNLTNPALGTDDLAVLKTILSQYDSLEAGWKQVHNFCQAIPSTLVHGDFRKKNVYVRTDDRTGTVLFPIDWETAGWGVAAADLAPSRSRYGGHHVDVITYWSIVRECWPGLDMSALQRLVRVGIVFRQLAAINWQSTSLGSEWAKEAVKLMRLYQAELSEILQDAQWEQ